MLFPLMKLAAVAEKSDRIKNTSPSVTFTFSRIWFCLSFETPVPVMFTMLVMV